MPNIASLLKAEIARVARKEIRGAISSLKTTSTSQRSAISALKQQVAALEKELRGVRKASVKTKPAAEEMANPGKTRFSAKGLALQRKRLGLSAHDCGLLLGASGQSIYNWEEGKVRPRDSHLAAIASLKTMGKRDAAARLATLQPQE